MYKLSTIKVLKGKVVFNIYTYKKNPDAKQNEYRILSSFKVTGNTARCIINNKGLQLKTEKSSILFFIFFYF